MRSLADETICNSVHSVFLGVGVRRSLLLKPIGMLYDTIDTLAYMGPIYKEQKKQKNKKRH